MKCTHAILLLLVSILSSGASFPAATSDNNATGNETVVGQTAAADGHFEMAVSDVFNITGRGVVATGQVGQGSVSVGDSVCLSSGETVTVEAIEVFRKVVDTLGPGDMGGLLLGDISKDQVQKGEVISSCP